MPILYQHQPDDLPVAATPFTIDDNSTDWWAGSQKCFATLGLAAVLSLTASQTFAAQGFFNQQDDPAGSLRGRYDEDFWTNPVAPVPVSFKQPLPLWNDQPEFAAPASIFDEDYRQNPVVPVIWSILYPQQWAFDRGDDLPILSTDEDLWQNPVPPLVASYRAFSPLDLEEIPAGSLHLPYDEDYWANPIRPIPASIYRSLPYFFDSGEIAYAPLTVAPEEDFWSNPVRPIPAAIWQRLPYLPDPEEIPATNLYIGLDETEWFSPLPAPISIKWPQQWTFEQNEYTTPTLPFIPDEDYWQQYIPPSVRYTPFPFTDEGDYAPVPVIPLPFDEDYWSNPVRPIPLSYSWVQQWPFEDQFSQRPIFTGFLVSTGASTVSTERTMGASTVSTLSVSGITVKLSLQTAGIVLEEF